MSLVLKRTKMKLFKQGQTVFYNGNEHIVETVFVVGWDLYLKLSFIHERVNAELVKSDDTTIEYYGNED